MAKEKKKAVVNPNKNINQPQVNKGGMNIYDDDFDVNRMWLVLFYLVCFWRQMIEGYFCIHWEKYRECSIKKILAYFFTIQRWINTIYDKWMIKAKKSQQSNLRTLKHSLINLRPLRQLNRLLVHLQVRKVNIDKLFLCQLAHYETL